MALAACALGVCAPLVAERILRAGSDHSTLGVLLVPGLTLLAAAAAQSCAAAANSWLLGGVALELVRDLRQRLYARLQQLPLAWFDRTPTGSILSRVMDDVAVVQGLASGQTLTILIEVATAAGAAAWLSTRSWQLGAVLAALVPLYAVLFFLFTRRIRLGMQHVRQQLDLVFGHLKQKIDGMLIVRANASEAAEVAEFQRQIHALHQPRVRVSQLGIAFSNLTSGVGGVGAALVFAIGAYEVSAGRLTTGELIAATAMAALIFAPITRLSELAGAYQQAATSLGRLGEILDFPDSQDGLRQGSELVVCGPRPLVAVLGAGSIEFDRVEFHYAADRPVLRDVSLRVESGSRVAIVGPTGSGKTTLLNLLLRFYEPTRGEIRLNGQPLGECSDAELRHQIGLVPQEAVVFRGTLAENIRYGTPDASQAAVEAAGRAARIEDLARGLPQGYETLVGEGGHPLSQGQRQRIALARLFCKNPGIVVLDEATSSLDRTSEIEVQQAMETLLAGRTTLVIAHRLATVRDADQIVVMDQGRIVQAGTHVELMVDRGGCYRRMFDSQFAVPPVAMPPVERQPARLHELRHSVPAVQRQPAAA